MSSTCRGNGREARIKFVKLRGIMEESAKANWRVSCNYLCLASLDFTWLGLARLCLVSRGFASLWWSRLVLLGFAWLRCHNWVSLQQTDGKRTNGRTDGVLDFAWLSSNLLGRVWCCLASLPFAAHCFAQGATSLSLIWLRLAELG